MTSTYDVRFADLQEQHTAVVCGRVPLREIAGFLGGAFGEVMAAVGAQGLHPVGPPFARYQVLGDTEFDIEAGFPVSGEVAATGRVEAGTLPGGRVATTLHVGDYAGVAAAYDAATRFVLDEGHEVAGAPWESYLDEPGVPRPRTEVFLPCRPVRAHAPAAAGP